MKLTVLIFLLIFALCDLKTKGVPKILIFFGLAIAIGLRWMIADLGWVSLGLSLFPAALLFLIAALTEETVGYADAWVFVIAGLLLSLKEVWSLLTLSMIINALAGGVLLLCRKKKLNDKMVFLPSVFFAFLIELLLL